MPSIWSNPSPRTKPFTTNPQNPGNITPVPVFTVDHGFNAFSPHQPPVIPAPKGAPAQTLAQRLAFIKKAVTIGH